MSIVSAVPAPTRRRLRCPPAELARTRLQSVLIPSVPRIVPTPRSDPANSWPGRPFLPTAARYPRAGVLPPLAKRGFHKGSVHLSSANLCLACAKGSRRPDSSRDTPQLRVTRNMTSFLGRRDARVRSQSYSVSRSSYTPGFEPVKSRQRQGNPVASGPERPHASLAQVNSQQRHSSTLAHQMLYARVGSQFRGPDDST